MNSRIFPNETGPFIGGRLPPGGSGGGDPDAVDLRGLLRTFWKRRWSILGVMLALGALTWFAVSQMTPVYTAQAKLILDPRNPDIITQDKVVADLDLTSQIVNGEIAVLRSNLLIEDAIRTIGAEALAPIDPALAPPSLRERLAERLNILLGRPAEDSPLPAADLDDPARTERLVRAVRRNLSVFSDGDSYVIVVRVEAGDPQVAALLANTLAERYITLQLDTRRDAVGQATDWLEERLTDLRAQVEEAEAAVANFSADSLLKDGGTLENASQQLASLNGQLITARSARVEAEARLDQLEKVIAEEGKEQAARIVTTPAIEALRAQALDLRQKDAVWAQSYDPDHPRRTEIAKELVQIESDITRELDKVIETRRSELEIARLREQSLEGSIGTTEDRVMSITRNSLGLRQLEREAAAARQTYESLLTRVTETRTQKQLQQPDAKMIERATVPGAPSAPRPKLMAVLAAAVGGSLMAGLVFFNEMTATTFRSAREIETETGLPVLALIPAERWRDMKRGIKALRAAPYTVYGERIRQLRTALLMRGGRDLVRSVLVLSSAPGEGKTTTTVALAEMAAMAGKSVIVIDCDLRRSTLQKAFGWSMENDFADFIKGDTTLSDAIFVPPDLGFDVLAAKGPRPDAAEELSVTWLQPVIEELKRVYDVVLIDAPALLAVSDAMILAQVVDTRVYLVAWNATPRAAVSEGLARLAEMRLPIDGIILNKFDQGRSSDPNAKGYTYES
ncbi:GumC family protein [Profundibacterium mesophilum]|uniref:non-specific protein-tyrosine kinase n=1 Tax=Profundibacterium mesophilum KAUST100406-0324 TaxID=1037889 RepID=A0A921NPA8_9RHOB|nr:polysaccharide biosynthesis tyrosine autokinase [Profundibacterium mesophilum]KAF0675861.1 Protein-tyrosine kinase [Profundibacterium mesophilum KAUST100406-0324]